MITDIGNGAFEYCYMLRMDEDNNLPKSLVTIGDNTFRYCQNINKIILPSKLESIEIVHFMIVQDLMVII